MPRPFFHDKSAHIDEMLRIDHAGEYGAVRIYQGQLKSISKSKDLISHMLDQEKEHLEYFKEEIVSRGTRPTFLMPIWDVFGFCLGYLSAKAGYRYAMLCTEAVEDVIDKHYQAQYVHVQAMDDKALAEKIEKHRLDEVEHMNIAIEKGSLSAPLYPYIKNLIGSLCKFAIFATRIV